MAFVKRPTGQKARGTGSSKHDNELLVKKDGCPIPLQSGCLKGVPPPQSTNEGIKMECSNANCPFKEELMHVECFEAFENNLIKIMSSIGSARGWTNAQRRANLWDKKGLSLIQKFCRCACGMGLLRLDQAEKDAATLTPRIPKTKKAKGKNLPTLNYSGSSTALLAGDKQSEKHEKKEPNDFPRYRSVLMDARPNSLITSIRDSERKTDHDTSIGTGSYKAGCMEHLSLISEPGTFPSKQIRGAVTNAGHELCKNLTDDDTGGGRFPASEPLSHPISDASKPMQQNQTSENDSGACIESLIDERVSISAADGDMSTCSLVSDISTGGSPEREQRPGTNEAEVDIASILLSPPETPPLCQEVAEARSEPHSEMSSDVNESYYNLFAGKSFYLGEMLLAEIHLPGALHIGIDMGHTAKGRPSFMK
uniref:Headcase protein n=1 Tax=Ascaris suum TaxID=6253 RepID=F1KY19_ASCSU